jgi:hypothetical protein
VPPSIPDATIREVSLSDGDSTDADRALENLIGVTLVPGEEDENNYFVNSKNGAITRIVKDDKVNPIANVPIQLQRIDNSTW